MTSKYLGQEGFYWFVGVVEDRDDPLKLGRVKVRIHNVHSDKKSVAPTSLLPWAHVMNSVHSASLNNVGIAPVGMVVGTTVIGFFMDATDSNYPVIIGTLASQKADGTTNLPLEATGVNRANKDPYGVEPNTKFGAKYPYNKVMRTESGHVIEVDDSPNYERIHIYHKSGSYIEISSDGRTVRKSKNDDFEVVIGNKSVDVKGDITINATGNITITAGGALVLNP